jgi:hypothetical protein
VRHTQAKHARAIANEIRAMRRSVSLLGRSIGRLAPILKAATSTNGRPTAPARKRLRLSPQMRAALKLQGRYMGFIRQLSPKQKEDVKRTRASRGIEAAIKKAEKLARA